MLKDITLGQFFPGKDFVNFCKFTKSQKRNNLLFLTPLYNSVAKSQCGSVSKY